MNTEFPVVDFSRLFNRDRTTFEDVPLCCVRDWNDLYADQIHRGSGRDFWEIDALESNPQNVYELCWTFKDAGLDLFIKNWEDLDYRESCFWKKHLMIPAQKREIPKTTVVFVFRDSENPSAPSFWKKLFPADIPSVSLRNVVPSRRSAQTEQPSGV